VLAALALLWMPAAAQRQVTQPYAVATSLVVFASKISP